MRSRWFSVGEIVLCGDFIDGLDKYATQAHKQYPETLNTQRQLLRWLIELLKNEFPVAKIVLVLGNHEADFRGTLFDSELLSLLYPELVVTRDYVDANGILYVHRLGKSARFGSQSGWTPSTVTRALSEIVNAERALQRRLAGLAAAHVHKCLDILQISGYTLILLPSFLKTGYETSEDKMYHPAVVLVGREEGGLLISVLSTEFNPVDKVVSFNDVLAAACRRSPEKVARIERALGLLSIID